jgi:hypothetical protein
MTDQPAFVHSSQRICHKLIADTAKGIAEAAYEIMASDDKFYRQWPDPEKFVAKHWKDFIGHARASVTVMLQLPTVDPGVKEKIYDALCLEGGFKAEPQHMIGAVPTAAEIARYGGLN